MDDLIPAWIDPKYEAEFRASWDDVEKSYVDQVNIGLSQCASLVEIVRELRQLGFDRLLRAGRSMFSLMLTRTNDPHSRRPEVQLKPYSDWIWLITKGDNRILDEARSRPVFDCFLVVCAEERRVRPRSDALTSDLLPLHIGDSAEDRYHKKNAEALKTFYPNCRYSRDPRSTDEFLRDLRWLAQRPVETPAGSPEAGAKGSGSA